MMPKIVSLLYRYFMPPLPLSFSERLCPTTGVQSCGNVEYFPRQLGFGNDTYSQFKGYSIETMGPASVPKCIITKLPVYSGAPFRP
jgi:hypothetical protein